MKLRERVVPLCQRVTMLRAEPISFAETPMELGGPNCLVAAARAEPRLVANRPQIDGLHSHAPNHGISPRYIQGAASASSTLGKIRKKFSRRAVSRIGRTSSLTPARIKIPP